MSQTMLAPAHIPVLVDEAVKVLNVQPGGRYIDCTLGGGGHAAAILRHSSPGGQLLGIDADPEAMKIARVRLEAFSDSTLLISDNFVSLQAICYKYDFLPVHGILFDLGLSSIQLNGSGRGFSFQHDAPLDMRLNPDQEITAADIVNTYTEAELAHLIRTYGEEGYSRRIARHIVWGRPIKTTLQLAQIIERVIGRRKSRIHPAARIEGPVLIGRDCIIGEGVQVKGPAVLGPRCEIGKGTVIEGSVLWHDLKVGEGAILKNCVAGAHGCIENSCHVLEDCVLGESTTVSEGTRLTPGTRIWPEGHTED